MIFNSVDLNIICFKTPCNLTIISDDGYVLKKVTINLYCSRICICTKAQKLKLIAKHNGQIIYKTIYLNSLNCQKICVKFLFNNNFLQRKNYAITLKDANYGFPILKGILKFKQLSYTYSVKK